jgi:hypothetical protein
VGPLERRVDKLEARVGMGWTEAQVACLIGEALTLMTEEDVHLLTEYLDRGGPEHAQPTEDEQRVLHRLEERFQEVQTERVR